MISIDGRQGGGQLLRTSLSLSAVLQKPFEITGIRGARTRAGLQPQHLTCVKAVSELTDALVEGAYLNSHHLLFTPMKVKSGKFTFDIGTAGSVSLLLQSILPTLVFSSKPSQLHLSGGTCVPWCPMHLYLQHVFLPTLTKMGFSDRLEVTKWGWYPRGGGLLHASVNPVKKLSAINLSERGKLKKISGVSAVSNLPMSIAERQKTRVLKELSEAGLSASIQVINAPSVGKGTAVFLAAEYENSIAGFSSLGERGKPAEKVAGECAKDFLEFHSLKQAADPHLADQMLLYMALAEGKSILTTTKITQHVATNIKVIQAFTPASFEVKGKVGEAGSISVKGIGFENKLLE